ncbi:hypothetical protein [Piscibacillus salipiscarius]|uniref:hypothetical protein n=1 Tax=Piscibacillus salipiscarius TaxID=299480 RepID=UPI0006D01A30|nr:hypothetical protein [Piscibacillus salipiscarius]
MALSGLEKVIIFASFNGEVHVMQAVKNLTPDYIWNITNITFWLGLIGFLIGLISFFLEKTLRKGGRSFSYTY